MQFSVKTLLAAERLKFRRTAARRLLCTASPALLALAFVLTGGHSVDLFACGWNWWYTLFYPTALLLFCAMSMGMETRTRCVNLLSLPASPKTLVLGKLLFCALASLAVNLLHGALVSLCSFYMVLPGLCGALLLSVTSLWMIPLALLLAVRWGLLGGVFPMMLLHMVSFLFAPGRFWWVLPSSVTLRVLTPVLRILPNGILLTAGAPQDDFSVILPGVALNLFWFALLTALALRAFSRMEVSR